MDIFTRLCAIFPDKRNEIEQCIRAVIEEFHLDENRDHDMIVAHCADRLIAPHIDDIPAELRQEALIQMAPERNDDIQVLAPDEDDAEPVLSPRAGHSRPHEYHNRKRRQFTFPPPGTSTSIDGEAPGPADMKKQVPNPPPAAPPLDVVDKKTLCRQLLLETHPFVDPAFFSDALLAQHGFDANRVSDVIFQMPGSVPKRPKLSSTSKQESANESFNSSLLSPQLEGADVEMDTGDDEARAPPKTFANWAALDAAKDYYDWRALATVPSAEYISDSERLLQNEFRMVSIASIRDVHRYCRYRYAPAFRILTLWKNDLLKDGKDFKDYRGETQAITATEYVDGEEKAFKAKILTQQRSVKYKRGTDGADDVCVELAQEIEWMREFPARAEGVRDRALRHSAAEKTGALFECPICYMEAIFEDMRACLDGHIFCKGCVQNYASAAVYGQGKRTLTCMADDCDSEFSRTTLMMTLTKQQLHIFDERVQQEEINLADLQNLERCKYCGYAVIVDAPPEVNKVFQCPNQRCLKEVCRVCKCDWNDEHFGKPCKEMETDVETKTRQKFEEEMAEAIIRRCHRCKQPMIKEEGCNRLTCRCKATLCYLCRAPDIDYAHFCTHPTNPGEGCKVCTRCMLWEKPELRDKRTLEELEAKRKECALELAKKKEAALARGVPLSAALSDEAGPSSSMQPPQPATNPQLLNVVPRFAPHVGAPGSAFQLQPPPLPAPFAFGQVPQLFAPYNQNAFRQDGFAAALNAFMLGMRGAK